LDAATSIQPLCTFSPLHLFFALRIDNSLAQSIWSVRLNEHMRFDEIFVRCLSHLWNICRLWNIRYYCSTNYDHQYHQSCQGNIFEKLSEIQDDLSLYCFAEETCLNWSIPVSTSTSRYPERCILSTSSFSSLIISLIMVQSFLFLSKETIASLRGGSLFATDIEQMGAYMDAGQDGDAVAPHHVRLQERDREVLQDDEGEDRTLLQQPAI